MRWPKRMYNFGAETHRDSGTNSAIVSRLQLLGRSLPLSLAVQLSEKVHEDSDYTAMIAVVHWCLRAETHPGGEVVCAVIISFLLAPSLTQLVQQAHHVMCVNWNEP